MAGQLLLVNPRRRRKSSGRKRRRSPRRMSALQRKYFGKRGHGRTVNPARRRRRGTKRQRRAHYASPLQTRLRTRRRRMSNPIRHHRRRRRNPIGMRGVTGTVMHAATGALGAIAVDVAWGFLPVPAQFKTGATGTLAKAAITLGLGMIASKALGRGMAEKATIGALTVQLYGFAKPIIAAAAPTIPGLGYYGAGYALNEYISDIPSSLNAFVPNSLMGLGMEQDYDTKNFPGDDLNMYIPMR